MDRSAILDSQRRSEKYLKKLMGNTDIEDSLSRLDKLTQEEARMASAELLKMTHGVDGKVMGVDNRVKSVEGKVEDVRSDVHDVGNKVEERIQDVRGDVQDVRGDVQDVDHRVQGVDDKLEQVNSSLSLNPCSFQVFTPHRREPAQRWSFTMAFASRSIHQPQHCMQSSPRRYSSMVFSRKYIQSMEVHWLVLMGTRKTCVTLRHHQVSIH